MKKTSLRALPETKLAGFQTLQIGNDCGIHSLIAAIGLLTGVKLNPNEVIKEAIRLWWRGHFFRVFPNSAIFPGMQVRILRWLAKKHDLPLSARVLHLSPEILRASAEADNLASLITIYWWHGHSPKIYYRDQAKNYNRENGISGHSMLFAAYDPDHTNDGIPTPWGFINSWVAGGSGLFWISDADFRRTWAAPIPFIGKNASVIISVDSTKTNKIKEELANHNLETI